MNDNLTKHYTKVYQIVTHDGHVYDIAQKDDAVIGKLANKLELVPVKLSDGEIEYFSKGTVARISSKHERAQVDQSTSLNAANATTQPPVDHRGTVSKERLAELKRNIFANKKTKKSKR